MIDRCSHIYSIYKVGQWGQYFHIKEFNCSHNWYSCSLRFSKFVIIVHWNFRESSSSVLCSLNMVVFGPMLAHITKLLWVSFKWFLSILAFSIKSWTKSFLDIFWYVGFSILHWLVFIIYFLISLKTNHHKYSTSRCIYKWNKCTYDIHIGYIKAGTKSCITPFTSIHSLNNWSSMSHRFEIVTCRSKEFTV